MTPMLEFWVEFKAGISLVAHDEVIAHVDAASLINEAQ